MSRLGNATSASDSLQNPFLNPYFAGTLSAALCGLGVWIYLLGREDQPEWSRKVPLLESKRVTYFKLSNKEAAYCLVIAASVSIFVLLWSGSIFITLPFTLFSSLIFLKYQRNREIRENNLISEVWPEVTDHLISGLHSGMSLSEALTGLAVRGPLIVRPYFLAFHADLVKSGDFSQSIHNLRSHFSSHASDQIFEAILLAKSLGGSELLQIFRTLGEFLRQDLAVRREIDVKHGWIKNSAHLSASAPWLLLLLLSSQPATAMAFNQPSGVLILIFGLILTGLAYFWMGRLGQMPKPPRVFGGSASCI